MGQRPPRCERSPNAATSADALQWAVCCLGVVTTLSYRPRCGAGRAQAGCVRCVCACACAPDVVLLWLGQEFAVRQDSVCGSTIGPILSTSLGIRTVDIGVAQLRWVWGVHAGHVCVCGGGGATHWGLCQPAVAAAALLRCTAALPAVSGCVACPLLLLDHLRARGAARMWACLGFPSMHSIREMCGASDVGSTVKLLTAFFDNFTAIDASVVGAD
jgi:hypothetical protein